MNIVNIKSPLFCCAVTANSLMALCYMCPSRHATSYKMESNQLEIGNYDTNATNVLMHFVSEIIIKFLSLHVDARETNSTLQEKQNCYFFKKESNFKY